MEYRIFLSKMKSYRWLYIISVLKMPPFSTYKFPLRKGHGVSAPDLCRLCLFKYGGEATDAHPSSMGNPHPLYYASPVADRFHKFWTLWWASTRHTRRVSMDAVRTVSMAEYELPNKGSDKAILSHSTGEGSIHDVCSLILTSPIRPHKI